MTFGENFFEDYAGQLVTNPDIALIELIANSFDAGADKITINWPLELNGDFFIEDNGEGMTKDEFIYRWTFLNYNRVKEQGDSIFYPLGNKKSKRRAFGRNGKGRFSAFCFSDKYFITTWKNNELNKFEVTKSLDQFSPFEIKLIKNKKKEKTGTRIDLIIENHYVPIDHIKDLICTKFISDPSVDLILNNEKIDLLSLGEQLVTKEVDTELGKIKIHFIEGEISGKSSLQNGITWWVNSRSVGPLSWFRMSEPGQLFIDRRTVEGKRYTFIVIADILIKYVKFDWSGFEIIKESPRNILKQVENVIEAWLRDLTYKPRIEQKKIIIEKNQSKIENLPKSSQDFIGKYIDDVQIKIPTMSEDSLSNSVAVLCNIEASRSGRDLLSALAKFSPDEMDKLYEIITQWTLQDAKLVLDELHWRLDLISQLTKLVNDPRTKELQQLQPLFEKGLWIFGPEYEGSTFTSNISLNKIIRSKLKGNNIGTVSPDMKNKRPDFVVLQESTIGAYSRAGFDLDTSEINGEEKVLILELKRGGFEITNKEIDQAKYYGIEILNSGSIIKSSNCISCIVLGSKVKLGTLSQKVGDNNEISVSPCLYDVVLKKANNRTFNLLKKIEEAKPEITYDKEIEGVLAGYHQGEFRS
jgi:hypothetical protein